MTAIRPLKKKEASFLEEMLYAAILVPPGAQQPPREITRAPELSIYHYNWGKDAFDVAYVLENEGELNGAIWGRLFTTDQKGFGFVNELTPELSMAIKPPYRGKGLGTTSIE